MTDINQSLKNGKPADQITASQPEKGIQVYLPSTARKREERTLLSLPRECQNVRYQRHTTPSGKIVLMPMDIPNQPAGGVEVAAQRMGKCTYVPMPDGTDGVRYRRIRNKVTGVVELTPISRPQIRRARRKASGPRTYTGTDIVNKIGSMLPCLNAEEKVVACLITLNTPVSITVDEQGDIGRTDFEKQTTTVYKDGQPVKVIDLRDVMPTEDDLSRFFEGMVELSGARRGRR